MEKRNIDTSGLKELFDFFDQIYPNFYSGYSLVLLHNKSFAKYILDTKIDELFSIQIELKHTPKHYTTIFQQLIYLIDLWQKEETDIYLFYNKL